MATAYFSVEGYDQVDRLVPPETQIRILVGNEERDRRNVQRAVLVEAQRELNHVAQADLVTAVEALLHRIEARQLRIADARSVRPKFHSKFYLSSGSLAWHGSANLSLNGLLNQAEQAHTVTDPGVIRQWGRWYDGVAHEADDLTDELAQRLRDWLGLADPFEAYLAALIALFDPRDTKREAGAHPPVHYQRALAAWGVRQVEAHRGALFVVSTGLGKTVVGAEIAARLRDDGRLARVLLIAPDAVHESWKRELEGRRIVTDPFDNGLLFKKVAGSGRGRVAELERQIDRADDRTLVLIDEAHLYRNLALHQEQASAPPLALRRVRRAVEGGAAVVLMTGSAYATDLQNLISLLGLLPPTMPPRSSALLQVPGPWTADEPTAFVGTPVVTVLGYPHVLRMARMRGEADEYGPYLPFEHARAYLPTEIRSRIVPYTLPAQAEALAAFDAGCFDSANRAHRRIYDDAQKAYDDVYSDGMYNVALRSWMSSARALRPIAQKTSDTTSADASMTLPLDGLRTAGNDLFGDPVSLGSTSDGSGYKTEFRMADLDRSDRLAPLLRVLGRKAAGTGDKAKHLARELRALPRADLKAVVFVTQRETALALSNSSASAPWGSGS